MAQISVTDNLRSLIWQAVQYRKVNNYQTKCIPDAYHEYPTQEEFKSVSDERQVLFLRGMSVECFRPHRQITLVLHGMDQSHLSDDLVRQILILSSKLIQLSKNCRLLFMSLPTHRITAEMRNM